MTATIDDPLLGTPLPVDDPADTARTADGLVAAADRVAVLGRRLVSMLPVQRWSGVASIAADRRLLLTAVVLRQERTRMLAAAEVLARFSAQVACGTVAGRRGEPAARRRASRAGRRRPPRRRHGAGDRMGQQPDRRQVPRPARGGAAAPGTRDCAAESRRCYDQAARRLTVELTELSGRRVVRAGMSARTWLDVAGFVPVVGDAVDAVNAAVYFAQGRWGEGLLTAAAVVPGPGGWLAGGGKIGKAVEHADDVAKVVDDVPPDVRARWVLSQLSVHGDNKTIRMLPDDESVERFYRDKLEHLGPTEVFRKDRGIESITTLPSGGTIGFRTFSDSGGYAIDVEDLPGLGIKRVHRPRD